MRLKGGEQQLLYDDIVHFYTETESINDTLTAVRELYPDTPISKVKVQRVLITEGLWESKTSTLVCDAYYRRLHHAQQQSVDEQLHLSQQKNPYAAEQGMKRSNHTNKQRVADNKVKISSKVIAAELGMSEKSVQQYLPYTKGEYGVSTQVAQWCEKYRQRKKAVEELAAGGEVELWQALVLFSGYRFRTATGLAFSYEIKLGRNREYTKELWIDKTDSKSLTWSSIIYAYKKIEKGRVYKRPKELCDSRGIGYLFPIFYRFGLIEVEEKVKGKMRR